MWIISTKEKMHKPTALISHSAATRKHLEARKTTANNIRYPSALQCVGGKTKCSVFFTFLYIYIF